MSVESPSPQEQEQRLRIELEVASAVLGFDATDPKEATPEHEDKLLEWINQNGLNFKELLENNPDVWERVSKGEATHGDVRWIVDQLSYTDTGDEDHTPGPEFDA